MWIAIHISKYTIQRRPVVNGWHTGCQATPEKPREVAILKLPEFCVCFKIQAIRKFMIPGLFSPNTLKPPTNIIISSWNMSWKHKHPKKILVNHEIFTQLKDDFSTKTMVTLRRSSRYFSPSPRDVGSMPTTAQGRWPWRFTEEKVEGMWIPRMWKKNRWQTMIDWWMDAWIDLFVFLVDWLIWLG